MSVDLDMADHSTLPAKTDKHEEKSMETLEVPQLAGNDHSGDGEIKSCAAEGIQGAQFQHSQVQTQNLQQLSTRPKSLSELSPTSVTQSISPAPSPVPPEQRLPLQKIDGLCMIEEDKQMSSGLVCTSPVPFVKTSASDGYKWRKYGEKQVKSPPGSRSYYRCTFSDCSVKKIQSSDISGHLIEIVYKSQHSHDPPRRSNCTREIEVASSTGCVGNNAVIHPCKLINDSELSTTSNEPIQENPVPETKRQSSSDSDGNGDIVMNEECEAKKRLKKSDSEYSDSHIKHGKPKFVVDAAGDVGISGDGYRWRKNGQKMVKGNPNPRNYYRCTSAGCPVRKHIETDVHNTSGVIITYKGIHDHGMPVPKKRHDPPSAPLLVAAAPASMNNLQIVQTDTGEEQSSNQLSMDKGSHQAPTQWSVDNAGGLTGQTLELGGEKAMESARTLLSIGFEIKPC